MSSPLIEQGVAALRAGDSATARRAFELAVAELECGSALEGLAEALYLEGEYSAAAGCYERAYTAYRRERQQMAAGRAARTVSWIAGNLFGDWAVGNGWLGRARTILTEAGEDSPERGWVRIIEAFAEPDVAARETLLRDAIAIGRRFGNADIEFEALVCLGGVFVMTDRVEEGLVLIDEALAAVCAGELVELIAAALCRAHYGGILTAAGRWDEAEAQLVESARQFGRGMPQRRAVALIRLADLRVRQGRLEEAAGLLEGLDTHPDAVRALAALPPGPWRNGARPRSPGAQHRRLGRRRSHRRRDDHGGPAARAARRRLSRRGQRPAPGPHRRSAARAVPHRGRGAGDGARVHSQRAARCTRLSKLGLRNRAAAAAYITRQQPSR